MGARPPSFEERPGRRHPVDRLQLTIPHDDRLDHDPTELPDAAVKPDWWRTWDGLVHRLIHPRLRLVDDGIPGWRRLVDKPVAAASGRA